MEALRHRCQWIVAVLACMAATVHGQNLLFDQISSPYLQTPFGTPALNFNLSQSFTPGLSGVGFVELQTVTYPEGGSSLSRVWLRQDGVDGPRLASTEPLLVEDNGLAIRTYFFPENISVTPGTKYWLEFELMSITGPAVDLSVQEVSPSSYTAGDMYFRGPQPDIDLWFREGMVIPEPKVVHMLVLGALGFGGCNWLARRSSHSCRRASTGSMRAARRAG
jgi:hypothetical protein